MVQFSYVDMRTITEVWEGSEYTPMSTPNSTRRHEVDQEKGLQTACMQPV